MNPFETALRRWWMVVGFLVVTTLVSGTLAVAGDTLRWKSQTLYVPVYSHVYSGDREHPFYLAATLCLRNTDMKHPIRILSADYYNSDGKLLASYLKEPQRIEALASRYFMIKESDRHGGVGAKFIVKWEADSPCTQPIVEAVMIGAKMQQGVSFICRGEILEGQSE